MSDSHRLISVSAAVLIALAGCQRADTDKKVAAQIKSGQKFKTVLGELSFDKKGDITRPDYVMYVWKKGADGKITYTEVGSGS